VGNYEKYRLCEGQEPLSAVASFYLVMEMSFVKNAAVLLIVQVWTDAAAAQLPTK
jgi:hypothetical protein